MDARIKHLQPVCYAVLAGILASVLGCGGKNAASPAPSASAQKLSYVDPSTAGYRLVRSGSSTDTHLVLSLLGPTGAQIQGGVFTLGTEAAKATWANAGGSDPLVLEGGALTLGSGARLLKSKLAGSTLEAAIYQKGVAAATLGQAPILSVALDLKAGSPEGLVSLSSPSAQILDAGGKTQAITVAVGTLSAE